MNLFNYKSLSSDRTSKQVLFSRYNGNLLTFSIIQQYWCIRRSLRRDTNNNIALAEDRETYIHSYAEQGQGAYIANQLTAITSGGVTRIKELDKNMNYHCCLNSL